jgi:hypothetical protein
MRLLRKYLTLAANEAVVTGIRRALGYQQISAATLASATFLTMPTVTLPNVPGSSGSGGQTVKVPVGLAIIQNNGTGAVRWRDDGTAPTSTIGMVLNAGAELDYTGDIANIQFILAAAAPILDVSLYGGIA